MLRVSENGHLLEALYYSTGEKKGPAGGGVAGAMDSGQSGCRGEKKKKRVGCFRIGFAGRSRDGD